MAKQRTTEEKRKLNREAQARHRDKGKESGRTTIILRWAIDEIEFALLMQDWHQINSIIRSVKRLTGNSGGPNLWSYGSASALTPCLDSQPSQVKLDAPTNGPSYSPYAIDYSAHFNNYLMNGMADLIPNYLGDGDSIQELQPSSCVVGDEIVVANSTGLPLR
jgi:hypothetical protein